MRKVQQGQPDNCLIVNDGGNSPQLDGFVLGKTLLLGDYIWGMDALLFWEV